MARGQVRTVPSNSSVLITTESKEEKSSLAVLNPNDGFIYIKMNGPAGSSIAQWDWKLPSQSYGLFPGPWQSIGIYYSDQSGSNRSADINVYDSDAKLYIPDIKSIGRAVALAGNALDISQGSTPANPPASTIRLWADGSGNLHKIDSAGNDETLLDSNSPLGGQLRGTVSTATISIANQDNIKLKNNVGTEVGWVMPWTDNTVYYQSLSATGGHNFRNSAATSLVLIGGDGNLTQSGPTHYFYAGASYITWRSDVSCMAFSHNILNYGTAYYFANNPGIFMSWNGAQITTSHSISMAGSTLYFASSGSVYLTWNGTQFVTSHALHIANAGNIAGAYIAVPARIGIQINLYDGGFGLGINPSELTFISAGNWGFRATTNSGTRVAYIDNLGNYWGGSSFYFGLSPSINITWNGTYLNHSHSIQYNTIGNQIVWPNGSYISGNAGYVQGSSRALKQSSYSLSDGELLAKVVDKRLPISSYLWADDTSRRNTGFMGDDIAQVLPELVVHNDNGEVSGYHAQEMTAILWGAVRQLESRVSALGG